MKSNRNRADLSLRRATSSQKLVVVPSVRYTHEVVGLVIDQLHRLQFDSCYL